MILQSFLSINFVTLSYLNRTFIRGLFFLRLNIIKLVLLVVCPNFNFLQ